MLASVEYKITLYLFPKMVTNAKLYRGSNTKIQGLLAL